MAKAPKKETQTTEAKTEPRIVNRYHDNIKIVVKAKENPKQPKTYAWDKYELFLSMSNGGRKKVLMGEYRAEFKKRKFGGDDVGKEISHCVKHGYIELEDVAKKVEVAA